MSLFKQTASVTWVRHKTGLIETRWEGGRFAAISQQLLWELQAGRVGHRINGRTYWIGDVRVRILPWPVVDPDSAFATFLVMRDGFCADMISLYQRTVMWVVSRSFSLELYWWMFILCASKDYVLDNFQRICFLRRKVSDFLLGDGKQ